MQSHRTSVRWSVTVRLAENFLAEAGMHLEAGILAIAAHDRAQILRHCKAVYEECTSHDPEKHERLPVARNRWRQLVCLAYYAGIPDIIQTVAEWAQKWDDPRTLAVTIVARGAAKDAHDLLTRLWQEFFADTERRAVAKEELMAALVLAHTFPGLALSDTVKERGEHIMTYGADAMMLQNPLDPRAYLPTGQPWPEARSLTSEEEKVRRSTIRRLIQEAQDRKTQAPDWSSDLHDSFATSHGLQMLAEAYPLAAALRR